MRHEPDTVSDLRTWMRDAVELDDRGLQVVLDRLPDTPQRKHRWLWPFERRPAGSGVTRRAASPRAARSWRSVDMLNATRAAAVVAVLALTGSLALLAGPVSQPGDRAPLFAAQAEDVELDKSPGFFTGTATIDRGQEPAVTGRFDRVEMRDAGSAVTFELDDPRVDASIGTTLMDYDDFPISGGRVGVVRLGTGRLENAGGAWTLSFLDGAMAQPENSQSYFYLTMVGEGAYDGLVGSMLMTDHDGAGSWQVTGTIFPEGSAPSE